MENRKLNIELFKKVRDRIATIPESYDQENWCTPSSKAPCGTTACLAGEAIICAAPTVERGVDDLRAIYEQDKKRGVPIRAAALLGLQGDWGAWLDEDDREGAGETLIFDAGAEGWPEPFREMFYDEGEAKAAVAYLDHIISTGKVLE